MLIRLTVLAAVAAGSCATGAAAQPFLEFTIRGTTYDTIADKITPIIASCVVDTSESPFFDNGSLYQFAPVAAASNDAFSDLSDSPVIAAPTAHDPGFVSATVLYDSTFETFTISIVNTTLLIRGMTGDFSNAASFLPGDPTAYRIDSAAPAAFMSLNDAIFPCGMTWTPASGFVMSCAPQVSGSYTVEVRQVGDPNAEKCIADLTGDGQLDFFDVSAYLQLFGLGCP